MNRIQEAAREGFLYQIWQGKPFPTLLKTIDGQNVTVIEKGVRNYDAGPDFLNALISLNGQLIRGDVEIHPLAGDWFAHRHHTDPRYNRVVLHVVTMYAPPYFTTTREDGAKVATLNLDDFLDTPTDQLECEAMELAVVAPMECRLAEVEAEQKEAVLRGAGANRLTVKSQRFAEMRSTTAWPQIVYSALAATLGYAKNHLPFIRLTHLLPIETLWRLVWNDPPDHAVLKCEAYLFGAAGMLPLPNSRSPIAVPPLNEYSQSLQALWLEFPDRNKVDPIKKESWQFFRLRPLNFPTRRIAALAALVVRFRQQGFIDPLLKLAEANIGKPKKFVAELDQRLTVGRHPFWSTHSMFDSEVMLQRSAANLIGLERSRDISVNVVFPILHAFCWETENHKSLSILRELYARFPGTEENEISKWMMGRLQLSVDEKRTCRNSASLMQGLIHLYKSVCAGEGICRRCLPCE